MKKILIVIAMMVTMATATMANSNYSTQRKNNTTVATQLKSNSKVYGISMEAESSIVARQVANSMNANFKSNGLTLSETRGNTTISMNQAGTTFASVSTEGNHVLVVQFNTQAQLDTVIQELVKAKSK